MSRGRYITEHEPGTMRGWRWHAKTSTVPCRACCHVYAVSVQRRRQRGKCARGLGWPL